MAEGKDTNGGKNEGGIDANPPFYIHASDYPKQMHVNDPLNDHNYTDWSHEMMNFLFAKNKVGFIDRSLKKPKNTSPNYMPWMRCDAMLKGWLTTAMEKEIRSSVKYAGTAREIWVDLVERFGKESAPRAFELKHALATTQKSGASVSAIRLITKGLHKGDVFVFPQGLVHFQRNVGNGYAVVIAALSSQNPGAITIANAVFGSNPDIAADILAKAFQVDKNVVYQIQSKF